MQETELRSGASNVSFILIYRDTIAKISSEKFLISGSLNARP